MRTVFTSKGTLLHDNNPVDSFPYPFLIKMPVGHPVALARASKTLHRLLEALYGTIYKLILSIILNISVQTMWKKSYGSQRPIVHKNIERHFYWNIQFNSPYLKKLRITPENPVCCYMLSYPNCNMFQCISRTLQFKKVMTSSETSCAQKFRWKWPF